MIKNKWKKYGVRFFLIEKILLLYFNLFECVCMVIFNNENLN